LQRYGLFEGQLCKVAVTGQSMKTMTRLRHKANKAYKRETNGKDKR
jgi:hypothetical protein